MDKATIIRKLDSAFSYLTVDIPEEVKIDNKNVKLRSEMEDIVKAAENGDLGRVIPSVIELEKDLSKLVNDFRSRISRSDIDTTEAETQLGYYLGIRRAIEILRGVSDESLKGFSEKDEKRRTADDRKRWYDSLKGFEEG
jgi:hypothetical protein